MEQRLAGLMCPGFNESTMKTDVGFAGDTYCFTMTTSYSKKGRTYFSM